MALLAAAVAALAVSCAVFAAPLAVSAVPCAFLAAAAAFSAAFFASVVFAALSAISDFALEISSAFFSTSAYPRWFQFEPSHTKVSITRSANGTSTEGEALGGSVQ